MSGPEEMIESVAATRPDAVVLASLVSLAARVEPFLLRRARLTLAPDRPAGAESELWFSPLVSSSSPRALVLRPDVAELLRKRLVEHNDQTLLWRAHRLVSEAHADAPPTLRLEEEVIWAALTDGAEAANQSLARAVATIREQPHRADGMARWALRAVPAMAPAMRMTPAAQVLRAGAELRMTSSSKRTLELPAQLSWLAIPYDAPRVQIGVRLLDGGLEFSDPPHDQAHPIELPQTEPMIIRIAQPAAPDASATVQIPRGAVTAFALDTGSGQITLTAADGETYYLREVERPVRTLSEIGRTGARTILPGSRQAFDPRHARLGDVDPDQRIDVSVYLRPITSLDWVDEMATRLPSMRQFATREEFGEAYGADAADVDAVRSFLAEQGIDITDLDPARRCVSGSGPISRIAPAFGVDELGVFEHPTRGAYRARAGALSVPAELEAVITAVAGIDTRPLTLPHIRRHSGQGPVPAYTPLQVARAYNVPRGVDGTGQTVAIVACGGGFNWNDLRSYFTNLGLPSPSVSVVEVNGAVNDPSLDPEADAQVMANLEIIGAVAPGASLVVYFTDTAERGMLDAVSTAVHDAGNRPSIITITWTAPEQAWTQQGLIQMERILTEAAAVGITVVASSGDGQSERGLAGSKSYVEFPASSPHVLACAGTSLALSGDQILSETAWSSNGTGGGGVSTAFPVPAHQAHLSMPVNVDTGAPGRGLPDVAAVADPQTGYTVLIDGLNETVGGTGASAPLWGGLCALMNQALGKPVGFISPLIYAAPHALHDIVEGRSGAYAATSGWDACTGLGSPDGTALLQALGGMSFLESAPAASSGSAPPAESPYAPLAESPEAPLAESLDTSLAEAPGAPGTDLLVTARRTFGLLMQNVASEERVFRDASGVVSQPGCIVAARFSPDAPRSLNWVRDAAIAAREIAFAATTSEDLAALADYVSFVGLCQRNVRPSLGHACFAIDGSPRPWTQEADGPGLQTLAILAAYPLLDARTRETAADVIGGNISFLLSAYRDPTVNAWEEVSGLSFFARAVQLRCFQEVASNELGLFVPPELPEAITWLETALTQHWDGMQYATLLPEPPAQAYDPNMEVVMASVYGAIPSTDPKLLATAAQLRSVWTSSDSATAYPINLQDAPRGIGPLVGRYPGDTYDAQSPGRGVGHPWASTTCNFAELYYRVAAEIARTRTVPWDTLTRQFFAQVGLGPNTSPSSATEALRRAGDRMLEAIVFHSDRLHLSEQFDATTGYAHGPPDVTWAYAAFLSAVRARTGNVAAGDATPPPPPPSPRAA